METSDYMNEAYYRYTVVQVLKQIASELKRIREILEEDTV